MEQTPKPEELLAVLVGLGCLAVLAVRWIREGEPTPEPWGSEVEQQLAQPETEPLCQRCLTPHSEAMWFCPECSLPVSSVTNFFPNLYPLSLGDAFRAFTAGNVPLNFLTVTGYLLASLAWFPILSPVYCFFLFRNLLVQRKQADAPSSPEHAGP